MTEQSVKPIVVIKIDVNTDLGAGGSFADQSSRIRMGMEDKFNDYHVLVLPKYYDKDPEPISLQVFHPKDFTPIQYQELKKLIETEIENLKTKL